MRLWDLRVPQQGCMARWLDPHDCTVFCVRSDDKNALLAGLSCHGAARLYDLRKTDSLPLRSFYSGYMTSAKNAQRQSVRSPVYCALLDHKSLLMGLDKKLTQIRFV